MTTERVAVLEAENERLWTIVRSTIGALRDMQATEKRRAKLLGDLEKLVTTRGGGGS
jgi:hypothetical protein